MEHPNIVYYDFNGIPTWNCYQERELEPPNNGDCNFNTEPT
jgi:hypothetical protein